MPSETRVTQVSGRGFRRCDRAWRRGLVKPRSPLADGIACCPIWDGPTNEKPRPATLLIGTSILVAGAGFEPTTFGVLSEAQPYSTINHVSPAQPRFSLHDAQSFSMIESASFLHVFLHAKPAIAPRQNYQAGRVSCSLPCNYTGNSNRTESAMMTTNWNQLIQEHDLANHTTKETGFGICMLLAEMGTAGPSSIQRPLPKNQSCLPLYFATNFTDHLHELPDSVNVHADVIEVLVL